VFCIDIIGLLDHIATNSSSTVVQCSSSSSSSSNVVIVVAVPIFRVHVNVSIYRILDTTYYSVQAKYTLLYSNLLYKRVYFAGTE
jgi:hypothetical protein